jgi:hypothetical protein
VKGKNNSKIEKNHTPQSKPILRNTPKSFLILFIKIRHLIHTVKGKRNAELEKEVYTTINNQFEEMLPKLRKVGWNLERCLLGPSEWRFTFGSKKNE